MTPDEPAENLDPVSSYRQIHESEWERVTRELPAGGLETRPLPGSGSLANGLFANGRSTEFDDSPTAAMASPVRIPVQQNGSSARREYAPTPPRPVPSAGGEAQIALWGATSSGKSTYLWSLPLAAEQQGWTVIPLDRASEEFKVRAETALLNDGLLPFPTQDEVLIRWRLERPPSVAGPWWRPRQIPGSQFVLRTIERRGGDFETLTQSVTDQLASADGIVYLFDPDRELNENRDDNVKFFIAAMARLQRRAAELDLLVDGRLPHHLAVCVTKLDAVKVFAKAREGFWVTQASEWPHFPRVAPHHARDFFEWLCRTELGDAANFVRERIVANFLPHRVKYFASSAIGFGLNGHRSRDGRGQFDLDDFSNLTSDGDRVRGMPRPINILEPLVAMERSRRFTGGPA